MHVLQSSSFNRSAAADIPHAQHLCLKNYKRCLDGGVIQSQKTSVSARDKEWKGVKHYLVDSLDVCGSDLVCMCMCCGRVVGESREWEVGQGGASAASQGEP